MKWITVIMSTLWQRDWDIKKLSNFQLVGGRVGVQIDWIRQPGFLQSLWSSPWAPNEMDMVSLGLWRSPAFWVREAWTHILALPLSNSDLGSYFSEHWFHYLWERDNNISGLLGGFNEITYLNHPTECPAGSKWAGNDSCCGLIFLKYI